ncbi:MAG TPA: sulfatase-like hydrolase/transferase, partial [bacterium]|nr:sulfatase-like hydrolase/transferase [bacterium]
RPNIVWLIADDAGWNDFGCYGHPTLKTPNIDALAGQGIRFMNAFVTTPQCSPSRASTWTGKYAHTIRAEDLHDPLPENETIITEPLQQEGYYCGNVGKLHLGKPTRRKLDFVHRDVEAWRNFLARRPKDRPFFLAAGFKDPHRPYPDSGDQILYRKSNVVVPPYLPDTDKVRQDLALYYSEISRMDDDIGQVMEQLRKDGVEENTLVIFWSDNGLPFPRAKGALYDPGIGTPLIFQWKRQFTPDVRRQLTSLIDLMPTTLDLAGIEPPADVRGRSFAPVLRHADQPGRTRVFAERNWHDIDDHIRAVRTRRFKYIRNYYPKEPFGFPSDVTRSRTFQTMRRLRDAGELSAEQLLIFRWPRPEEELYDLEKDPNEFHNVVHNPAYQDVLKNLRTELDRWITETDDVPPEKRKPDKTTCETGEET